MAAVIVAVVSDMHSNSKVGLLPAGGIVDDSGNAHKPNPGQRWLWARWLQFWASVAELARNANIARTVVIVDGDAIDCNKKSSQQLICTDEATIVKTGEAILRPALDIASEVYIVRGTANHTGGLGALEELLATNIHAIGPRADVHSWYCLQKEFEGVRFNVSHHPQTTSTRPWLVGSAACRQAAILAGVFSKRRAPHVALRGHVHHFEDSGINFPTRVFFLPSWTLDGGEYEARIGLSGYPAHPGGLVFICDNGQYQINRVKYGAD